jgi:hypothetical protein
MASRRIVLLAALMAWLGGWALYIAAVSYAPPSGGGAATKNPRCTKLMGYEWLAPAWICLVSGAFFFLIPQRGAFLGEDEQERYDRGLDRLVFVLALVYFIAAAPAFALILNSCMMEYTIYVPVNTQPPDAAKPNLDGRGSNVKPIKQRVVVAPRFVQGGLLMGQLVLTLIGMMVFYEWATYTPRAPPEAPAISFALN